MQQQLAHRTRVRAGAAPPASSPAAPPQRAPVDLTDAKTQAFVQWCTSKLGVACDKLRPASFGGLRGMACTKPIAQEDMLLSIPRASALVVTPKQRCPCPDFVTAEYWGAAPWFVKLGLLLLRERSLGLQSKLHAYVEQLPNSFEAPVLWSAKQLEALQYPALVDKVAAQRKEWEGLHQRLRAGGQPPGAPPVALDTFLWALCAVRSRTFSGPYIGTSLPDRLKLGGLVGALGLANVALGLADVERTLTAIIAVFTFNVLYEVILSQNLKQYALAPLLDFCNHSSTVQSEVSLDYFTDRYSVVAGRAFAPGEQVFISYGAEQTNDSLLQYYGFVEPDCPKDHYVLTRALQWLPAHVPQAQLEARIKQLEQANLLKPGLQNVVVARQGFPATTLQALRFVLADNTQAAGGPGQFAKAGSESDERRLAQLLVALCRDELKAMGTSLAEDQQRLAAPEARKGVAREETLALQFRVQKKLVLHACLASLGAAPA